MNKTQENVLKAQEFLEKKLDMGDKYSKQVQHEAVEALGNLNQDNTLKLLKRYEHEPAEVLYETCYLAQKLIEWKRDTDNGAKEGLDKIKLKCHTNDPAPLYNYVQDKKYADIKFLEQILLDNKNYDLF